MPVPDQTYFTEEEILIKVTIINVIKIFVRTEELLEHDEPQFLGENCVHLSAESSICLA